MASTTLILIATFVGVAALVAAVAAVFTQRPRTAETRLERFTTSLARGRSAQSVSVLAEPLSDKQSVFDRLLESLRLDRFLEQSGLKLSAERFCLITLACTFGAGAVAGMFFGWPVGVTVGLVAASLPLIAVWFMRKRRLAAFARQLPEALELISRALRAGHSLAAGISLVAEEMPDPIRSEFHRCYEEQNLGVSLEESLQDMTARVPNLDLRFFVTAVILQRQTGGDLAEILDKIGRLIRERFQIWGQIQALTGEGRLSGIVLLALPPVLFLVMYRLNPEYCMVLFRDPMGQKMLLGAVVMQVLGAVVIRKIVNIEV
jgi:tight adherence protein B